MNYLSYGQGAGVVLLHGFCEDHRIWQVMATGLAEHYHVITPDLPGSGNTAAGSTNLDDWAREPNGQSSRTRDRFRPRGSGTGLLVSGQLGSFVRQSMAVELSRR